MRDPVETIVALRTLRRQAHRSRRAVRYLGFATGVALYALLVPTLLTAAPMPPAGSGRVVSLRVLHNRAGDAPSSACGHVATRYETAFAPRGYVITAVLLSGLEPGRCAGLNVVVNLAGAAGVVATGSATVSAGDAAVRVPISGSPLAEPTTRITITVGKA